MKQPRVQLKVLSHRQFAIQRKRLGHIAHTAPGFDVFRVDRLTEQQRLPFGGRLQAGEHFHRGRLATAIGAEEAEYLTTLDTKIHMIDGHEIAEAARQAVSLDGHCGFATARGPGRYHQRMVATALFFRKQRNKGFLQVLAVSLFQQVVRGTSVQNFPCVHGHQPVETLGFVHIRGGHQHAHAGAIATNAGNQLPELITGQGIDASGGLIENQQIRVVNQRAAQPQLLLHAARELAGRAIGKAFKPGALHQIVDPPLAFGGVLAKQATEKIQIFEDGQGGVQVLAQALRHVGNARANLTSMLGTGHIAVQHLHRTLLELSGPRDQGQQAGLANAIRTDQANHTVGRDVQGHIIQRADFTVVQAHLIELRHHRIGFGHCGTLT